MAEIKFRFFLKDLSTGQSDRLERGIILPAWFDQEEENFSYKDAQIKMLCSHMKNSFLPAENIDEAPRLMQKYFLLHSSQYTTSHRPFSILSHVL